MQLETYSLEGLGLLFHLVEELVGMTDSFAIDTADPAINDAQAAALL